MSKMCACTEPNEMCSYCIERREKKAMSIERAVTPDNYIEFAIQTAKVFPDGLHLTQTQAEILHACIGASGEAGELIDGFKKHLIYGKPLNVENLVEEAGDLLWYLALLFDAIDVDFKTVMVHNITKLKTRYPEKYTDAAAIARADKEEGQ